MSKSNQNLGLIFCSSLITRHFSLFFGSIENHRTRHSRVSGNPPGPISAKDIPSAFSVGWIKVIEHPVDHHAGDGNIEPDGQRPSGDPPVAAKPSPQRAIESDQRQGNDSRRQNAVAPQQHQIKSPDRPPACEMDHAVMRVIPEITDEKGARGCKSRQHAALVGANFLSANGNITQRQENRAGSIQGCVEGGEINRRKYQSRSSLEMASVNRQLIQHHESVNQRQVNDGRQQNAARYRIGSGDGKPNAAVNEQNSQDQGSKKINLTRVSG